MRFTQTIVVDVTTMNFNLLFEIGVALGLEQPVLPVRDTTLLTSKDAFQELGLLDTIGYIDFSNSDNLARAIQDRLPAYAIPAPNVDLNKEAPLYVLKCPIPTEGDIRMLSVLKKSALRFRTLDILETPRIPLTEARRQVEESLALVAHLLHPDRVGAKVHNGRCALLAGIAFASGKAVLLIQEGDVQQPIDYRDVVVPYRSPEQVPRLMEPYLRRVITRLQDRTQPTLRRPERFLEKLDIGDVAAENEILALRSYFVRTAQYNEARRGFARLVTGRKGAGKTAIFYAVREAIPRGHSHLVLDLKPEGHQFTKLREAVLQRLSPGLQEHTLAAFWSYILLCEIAQKVRDRDFNWAQRDPERRGRFETLVDAYSRQASADAGDFSERLLRQVDTLTARFSAADGRPFTGSELTEMLFRSDIRDLENAVAPYLEEKDAVWVLVDNLDKGWPTRGASSSDILILRSLLEATRKLQRQLERRNVEFHSLVFLRNDIYDHLIQETSDRGKDTAITLDWNDVEIFKQIIAERIRASTSEKGEFDALWALVATPNVGTRGSFDWVVERTLMRPRDMLTFVHGAIGVAINRAHDRIREEDFRKAEETYSEDLLLATAWEIRDVIPEAIDVLYRFQGCAMHLSSEEVLRRLHIDGGPSAQFMLELLVWFGFLGVIHIHDSAAEPQYSYQVRYNIEKLLAPLATDAAHFSIHPAYHRALSVPED
jgi:hypothetical protein